MENKEIQSLECCDCKHTISTQTNFCPACGSRQQQENPDATSSEKWSNLKQITLFFAIEIIWCVSGVIIPTRTLLIEVFFDVGMALTAVYFFSQDWRQNKVLLKWPKFSIIKLVSFIILTITVSLVVQFSVDYLNRNFFHKDTSVFELYKPHKYGKYIMIVSVAVFPAVFEELAFRGYLMQKLLKIVDQKEAIYITSILFFLIHFSFVSFFWMLPFAFLLGYVRIKEKTLWYGIVVHFFFNLTSCMVAILW